MSQVNFPSSSAVRGYLRFAREVIEKARALILTFAESGFSSERKSDLSLVTEADMAAERLLRQEISSAFPDHGIIGEELPNQQPAAPFQWIIDPIDGTQNFAHSIPTYGTILGLHFNGVPLCGVIDHPAMNLRLWAGQGEGTYCNDRRITLSQHSGGLDVNDIVGLSTRGMFARTSDEPIFDELVRVHGSHRIYYDVYATSLAIQGCMAAMVEYNCTLWDISCTRLMIEEAGGAYRLLREVPRPELPPRVSAIYGRSGAVLDLLGRIESWKALR